ncbi:MAG: alpha/beta hydrolase [Pseudolysinimonas sp.]
MGWLRNLFRKPPLLHVAIDTGSGSPVVMIHGIASSSVTFERLVPLVEPYHRVIAIDLLGFGESEAPDWATFTIEEHVVALARTLRSLKLREPFVLVGHSMGALIAARYAAGRPAHLARIVLVSPPVYITPTAIAGSRDRAAMDVYLRIYDYLRSNKEFTIKAAASLARLSPIKNLLDISEGNWRAFAMSLENLIETQTTVSDLAAVRVPVHVVWGSLDPLLTPSGLRIVEQLRGVESHRVDGGDHVIRTAMARVIATAIG